MAKRGRKPQDPALKQAIVNSSFAKVVKLVEKGDTIYKALKKLGISRSLFYKFLTKEKKLKLQVTKTLNAEFGINDYRTSINRIEYVVVVEP